MDPCDAPADAVLIDFDFCGDDDAEGQPICASCGRQLMAQRVTECVAATATAPAPAPAPNVLMVEATVGPVQAAAAGSTEDAGSTERATEHCGWTEFMDDDALFTWHCAGATEMDDLTRAGCMSYVADGDDFGFSDEEDDDEATLVADDEEMPILVADEQQEPTDTAVDAVACEPHSESLDDAAASDEADDVDGPLLEAARRAALADAVAQALPGLNAHLAEQRALFEHMSRRCETIKKLIAGETIRVAADDALAAKFAAVTETMGGTTPARRALGQANGEGRSRPEATPEMQPAYLFYRECPARERLRAALDECTQRGGGSAMTTSFCAPPNLAPHPAGAHTHARVEADVEAELAAEAKARACAFTRSLAMHTDFPDPLHFGVGSAAPAPATCSSKCRPAPAEPLVPAWEFSLRQSAEAQQRRHAELHQRCEDVIACLRTNLAEAQSDLQAARAHARRLQEDNDGLRYELDDARADIARLEADNADLRSDLENGRPWMRAFAYQYEL